MFIQGKNNWNQCSKLRIIRIVISKDKGRQKKTDKKKSRTEVTNNRNV